MQASVAQNGPIRTCISCRETGRKEDLLRLAGEGATTTADPLKRMLGRGRYVHVTEACLTIAGKQTSGGKKFQEFQCMIQRALEQQLKKDAMEAQRHGWPSNRNAERTNNRLMRRIRTLQSWTQHTASAANSGC